MIFPKYKFMLKQQLDKDVYIIYKRHWFCYREVGRISVPVVGGTTRGNIYSLLRMQGVDDTNWCIRLATSIYDCVCISQKGMEYGAREFDRYIRD